MKKLQQKIIGLSPLMGIMFINSFIDLGHKITLQNTVFKVYDGSTQIALTAIINGLILLPFIFFYRSAGFISDKYAKTQVVRYAAVFALLISVFIFISYLLGWFWLSFGLTFILAVQSAFVSPAKYGLIREMAPNSALTTANAKAQTLVTLGILFGSFSFTLLFEALYPNIAEATPQVILKTLYPLGLLLILMSLIELILAWRIPLIAAVSQQKHITSNHSVATIKHDELLWPVVIGLCAFWSVGQMLLATYPSFAEDVLDIDNTIIIQALMLTLGFGIMIGSSLTSALLKNQISLALVPFAGIAIILSLLLLPFISVITAVFFLFAAIGFFGGIFVVPLNTIFQFCAKKDEIGKNLASLNLIKNIAMVLCLIITIVFSIMNIDAFNILFLIGATAIVGIGYLLIKAPHSFTAMKGKLTTSGKKYDIEGFDNLTGSEEIWFHCHSTNQKTQLILQAFYPRRIKKYQHRENNNLAYSGKAHSWLVNDQSLLAMPYEEKSTQSIDVSITEDENRIKIKLTSKDN